MSAFKLDSYTIFYPNSKHFPWISYCSYSFLYTHLHALTDSEKVLLNPVLHARHSRYKEKWTDPCLLCYKMLRELYAAEPKPQPGSRALLKRTLHSAQMGTTRDSKQGKALVSSALRLMILTAVEKRFKVTHTETWKQWLGDHTNSGKVFWKLNEVREMEKRGWVCETAWKHVTNRQIQVHRRKNRKQKYEGTVERDSW